MTRSPPAAWSTRPSAASGRCRHRLAAWAQANDMSFSPPSTQCEAGISGKALRGAAQLAELLDELRELMERTGPGEVIHAVAERTGYLAELVAERSHEADGRLENIAELEGWRGPTRISPSSWRPWPRGGLRRDRRRRHRGVPHDAAHREGTRVPRGLPGRARRRDLPPSAPSATTPSSKRRRRLCYVGITRARRFLYLRHAGSAPCGAPRRHNIPSRFLAEIPEELVRDVGVVAPRRADGATWRRTALAAAATTPSGGAVARRATAGAEGFDGARTSALVAGDVVVHERWGEGTV